ncbi:E3 ubiquitin-protein ligase rnf4 [Desmophyllum pertusum]|uniref:E3 ubiquitin-protein ligase rnf4 n=1 Tax=Desmophyllum pertusum TaxID=174260 RepID=A0A9X0A473_9CNID|nr:E3 ubiquitin-protein ligase rnf4 [Desmophyllum pertusum]
MNKPVSRGRKRKKRVNIAPPLDEPSTSSSLLEGEDLPLPSTAQEEVTTPELQGRKRKKRVNIAPPLDEPSTSSSLLEGEDLPLPGTAQEEVTTPDLQFNYFFQLITIQGGRKRKKRVNVTPPLDEPSTSSSLLEGEDLPLPSTAQEEVTTPELQEEFLLRENKRSRIDDETEESTTENTVDSEPVTVDSQTAESRTDSEPITVESPTVSRSQEDVMIVGDVQVARPEVIDLERLPTIRQGGSIVVDLTNDSSFYDSNVVDLTRENSADSSIDSSPVIVCVNRIYRGDPIRQLPSCRFAQPSVLGRGLFDTEDEVQEVVDNNVTNEENTSVVEASTSSSDNPAPKSPLKKITCPICMDDEQTIKRRKRKLMSTTCGHVFCDQCIRSAVQMQSKCPTCRKKLSLKQLHPIFL